LVRFLRLQLYLKCSSANLDNQNGGFTVFGDVISGQNVLALFNTTFNQASTGGRGVYDASSQLGADFTTLPLLANSLTAGNLIYTKWTIVPESGICGLLLWSGFGLLCVRIRRPALTG